MHPVRSPTMPDAVYRSEIDRFSGLKSCYQERSLSQALTENRITQDETCLISAFVSERRITAGISSKRSLKQVSSLITIHRLIPQYHALTISSVYQGIERINSEKTTLVVVGLAERSVNRKIIRTR